MQQVIQPNGQKISVADWQIIEKLPKNKVATYFTIAELDCEGEILIAVPLLRLLDAFRTEIGVPVKIGGRSGGYRTFERQKELQGRKDLLAASVSPHCYGMAADIDTANWKQTKEYVKILKQLAVKLNFQIRLGYTQYHNKGQSFVHVDVCPMYYGKNKPFHSQKHPAVWEVDNKEW